MNLDAFPEVRVDPSVDPDRRYTTTRTMELCLRLSGLSGFDLDVAADAESHWAHDWYGLGDNGLLKPWALFSQRSAREGARVWCNPPYSDLMPWLDKAWEECTIAQSQHWAPFSIAMLLPGDRGEQPWWQRYVEPYRDGRRRNVLASQFELTSHVLPGRQVFGHPGNKEGVAKTSAPFPSVLLVWRRTP